MVAELAKEGDGFERLRVLALEESFRSGGLHEELVEGELEGREGAEDDVLVFDGDCARVSVRREEVRGTHGIWRGDRWCDG